MLANSLRKLSSSALSGLRPLVLQVRPLQQGHSWRQLLGHPPPVA